MTGLEQQGKLDFDSLKDMAEAVHGNFTFTVLDENNSLYIVKGSNPMFLLHFEALGIYVYASTESIMRNALMKLGWNVFKSERVETSEGDILRIDSNGIISRYDFEPAVYRSKFMSLCDNEPYYSVHEEMLLAYCGCYGVDSEDVEMLLEYGFTCDEIEDMLMDTTLLHETLCAVTGDERYSDRLLEVF